MHKKLLGVTLISVLTVGTGASAQTDTYIVEGTAEAVITMPLPPADPVSPEAGVQMMIVETDEGQQMPAGMPAPQPGMRVGRPANPPRKTNREIIELRRMLKEKAENGDLDGPANVPLRVNPAKLRELLSDQMPRQNASGTPDKTGRPMFFRLPAQAGASTTKARPGMIIRAEAASGSRAVFLRNASGTLERPRISDIMFVQARNIGGTTTVDANGNVLFSFEEKRPPLRLFMEKMFNLFQKTTVQNNQ